MIHQKWDIVQLNFNGDLVMKEFLFVLSILIGFFALILIMNGSIEKQWAFSLLFVGFFLWSFLNKEKNR